MKTRVNFSLLAIMVIVMLLSSCRKREEVPVTEPDPDETEQSTAVDNNLAEVFAADIESIGSEVAENQKLESYRSAEENAGKQALSVSPCATITSASMVYTVDFGTVGCIGLDGRTRTGKLIYDFSTSAPNASFYRNPGFVMIVSSQNYQVNNYLVNIINKTVKNTTTASLPPGYNPGTNLTWSVNVNIAIVKPNNAGTITWQSNRTKELINTGDTNCYKGQAQHIRWKAAKVQINGGTSGVNAKSINFVSTASNLVRDFNCSPDPNRPHWHPFLSGTLSYTPGNKPVRILNYGTGACDMNAVLSVKGQTFSIVLP